MSNDRSLRFACAGAAFLLAAFAYLLQGHVDPRAQALCGIVCFILVIASCSSNLRAVNVRTVAWGIGLQFLLAVFILKLEVFGVRPGYEFFNGVAAIVKRFLAFTREGATFVFGDLAKQEVLGKVLPNGFVFAFTALPTIIFISSFFTVLYYYGILQRVVALMAGGNARAQATPEVWTITIDMFSGLPNPTFTLTAAEVAELKARLGRAPAMAAAAMPATTIRPSILGYRGIIIKATAGSRVVEDAEISKGRIFRKGPGARALMDDSGTSLERYLASLAVSKGVVASAAAQHLMSKVP